MDLQLQHISRDTVYKQIVNHVADRRPKAAESEPTRSPRRTSTGRLVQFLSDCYHVFDAADPAALTAFIQ